MLQLEKPRKDFKELVGHHIITLALIGTSLIALIVRATIGLRITPEIERQGLDINLHGEEGYIVSG